MNKLSYWFIALLLGANISVSQSITETRTPFKVVLKAIDDNGNPVAGANLGFSWGLLGNPKPDTDYSNTLADGNGAASFSGETKFGRYAYGASKDGYYSTRGIKGQFTTNKKGQWEPWGLTINVLLRPIKRPVPMYAKALTGWLPARETWVGYDLQKGDWVSPWGKGTLADIEFRYVGSVEDNFNYDGQLELRLPGAGNGIQSWETDQTNGSEFRMPYEAPQDGYTSYWVWRNARITDKKPGATSTFVDESYPQRGFLLRTRAVVDSNGRIVRASYGKIHGPFIFDSRSDNGCGYISFKYYLNPDETRNLEFAPKQNLFVGQNIMEP